MFKLYQFVLLLFFLASMKAWFTWGWESQYVGLATSVVSVAYVVINKVKLTYTFNNSVAILLLIFSEIIGLDSLSISGVLGQFLILVPIYIFISVRSVKFYRYFLNYLLTFFSVLMPVSLGVFFLGLNGWFPSFGTISPKLDSYGSFQNHILCLVSDFYSFRFSSIFLEPGHLGMIISLLLYSAKFNFKDKRILIILVCSLFTLSLSYYVLTLFAYLLYLYSENKLKLQYFVGTALVTSVLFFAAINYNKGDNLVNTLIIERLAYDSEKGFAGNNRVYGDTDLFFDKMLENERFWFGYGVEKYSQMMYEQNIGGAGWKIYIIQRGIISLFFVLVAYVLLLDTNSLNKKYAYCFLLLLILTFWQRSYPIWASWLMTVIVGIGTHGTKQLNREKDKRAAFIK